MNCRYRSGDGQTTRIEVRDQLTHVMDRLTRIEDLLKLMAPPQAPAYNSGVRVYDEEGELIRE